MMLRKTKKNMQQSQEATSALPTNVQSNVSHFMQVIMDNYNATLMQLLGKYYFQKQPLEVFCKKKCFKNFPKFTGKYLCWSLFLKAPAHAFSGKFYEIFKNPYFVEPLQTAAPEFFETLNFVSS